MRISDWSSDVCSSDLRDLVDAADQFGEELAVQVGQDHADGVGAAAAEAARGVVRAVTQLVGHAEHALAYGLGHVLVTVEGPRHRRHRYVRSEERRVGNAWFSTCGSRWSPVP